MRTPCEGKPHPRTNLGKNLGGRNLDSGILIVKYFLDWQLMLFSYKFTSR